MTAPSSGPTSGPTSGTPTWRAVEQVMGLPISVALRGRHAGDDAGRAAWDAVVAELREVDRLFSPYRPDSVISRLDRGELDEAAACVEAPGLAEVLVWAAAAERESGGAFAVRRPDPATGRLRFDPSGVVKGWAVQRAARHLQALRGTDSCLSGGGDLVCHVASASSRDWVIGIEDPRDAQALVARVPVRRGAVATSGLSHRGAHVVDARTGVAPSAVASVSVLAPTLVEADLDATCALALDAEAAVWLATRPGRVAVVVWADGGVETVVGRASAA